MGGQSDIRFASPNKSKRAEMSAWNDMLGNTPPDNHWSATLQAPQNKCGMDLG